jgi:hypothetical protein
MTFDSSVLTIENVSLAAGDAVLWALGSSSVKIIEQSTRFKLLILTSGEVFVQNSNVTYLWTYPSIAGTSINLTILDSTVEQAYLFGSSVVTIENSTIIELYEGIVYATGSFTWNPSGSVGSGSYYNYTTLRSNLISQRTLTFVEVIGATNLIIQDIFKDLRIVTSHNAVVTIQNSTIGTIDSYNSSVVTVNNCSDVTNSWINAYGHSNIKLQQASNLFAIVAKESGVINIDTGTYYATYVRNNGRITINQATVTDARVNAHSPPDYAMEIHNSTISTLLTTGWGLP